MRSLLGIGLVAVLGAPAFADKKETADELFAKAKRLMADKKYAEACPKFEESFKLDPGIGGELNIAKCYEDWGKLGRAFRAYEDAERLAKQAGDQRETKIHDLVVQLDTQVPRLVIHIPAGADTNGLRLTIDGVVVDKAALADAQLVDPGPKQIEYQLANGPKKTKLVPVERGGTSEITLDLPKARAVAKLPPDVPEKTHELPAPHVVGRSQRIAGVVIGSAGVVAIGISSVVALSARSKYNTALANDCNHMPTDCDPKGLTDTHDARHDANIATVVFGVGAAALIGGVVVYLVAPKAAATEHAYYLVPTVGSTGGGIAFGGRL